MSISTDANTCVFTGNNSTVTAYVVPFRFDDPSWLSVSRISTTGVGTMLSLGTGFTVSGQNLRTIVGIPSPDTLRIRRNTPILQTVQSSSSAQAYSTTLETQLDQTTMALQDVARDAGVSTAQEILDEAEAAAGLASTSAATASAAAISAAGAAISASGSSSTAAATAASIVQTFVNPTSLRLFAKACQTYVESSDPLGQYIVCGKIGDSIEDGNGPGAFIDHYMLRTFGIGALYSSTFQVGSGGVGGFLEVALGNPNKSSTVAALTGGATYYQGTGGFGDARYLPNGSWYSIPAGGTTTESPYTGTTRCNFQKITAIFGKQIGGGDATITVTQFGVQTVSKVVSTAEVSALNGLAYIDITAADGLLAHGQPAIVVTASSGSVNYIGSFVFLRGGYIAVRMCYGGTDTVFWSTVPDSNWQSFAAKMGVQMFRFGCKENIPSALATWMNHMRALFPSVPFLFGAQTPTATEATTDIPINNAMKAACIANGFTFSDRYAICKSFAEVIALGWQGDGVHLDTELHRFVANVEITGIFLGAIVSKSNAVPLLRSEFEHEFLRETVRRSVPYIDAAPATTNSPNFTLSQGEGKTFSFPAATAPTVSASNGVQVMSTLNFNGKFSTRYRWQIKEVAFQTGMQAWLLIGDNARNGLSLTAAGVAVEFGFAVGPSSSSTPYVRTHVHDGSSLYSSPQIWLPGPLEADFGYSGVGWSNFSLDYISMASGAKRTRILFSSCDPSAGQVLGLKPVCILDHTTPVVSNANFGSSTTNHAVWRAQTASSVATPTFGSSVTLLTFEADRNLYVNDPLPNW